MDQMHQDNANMTALAAIGPRRLRTPVSYVLFCIALSVDVFNY